MAVVVNPRYSIQAVAGKHNVVEGRGVIFEVNQFVGDLPSVEYPSNNNTKKVWVALHPPDNLPLPTPRSLYTASYKAIYNLNDDAIYDNPIFSEEYWLVKHSTMKAPTINRYEKLALYKGIIGITEECYQHTSKIIQHGTSLAISNNGRFIDVDKNHPTTVAETIDYVHSTGMLFINVF